MNPIQPRFVEVSRREVSTVPLTPPTPNPAFVHMFPKPVQK